MPNPLRSVLGILWQIKEAYLEFVRSFSSQVLLLSIFAVILHRVGRQEDRWDYWFIGVAVPFGLFFLYAYLANIAVFYKKAMQKLHRAARGEVRRLCRQKRYGEVRRLCRQKRYAEARIHLRHIRNRHYLIAPLIILTLITLGSFIILILAYQASLSLYQNLQAATPRT